MTCADLYPAESSLAATAKRERMRLVEIGLQAWSFTVKLQPISIGGFRTLDTLNMGNSDKRSKHEYH